MKAFEIKGKPSFKPGDKTGYFLWKDQDGFHLVWTTTGDLHGFKGKITGNKPLVLKKVLKLETNDQILQPDPNKITWITRTGSDTDGMIFDAEEDFTLDLGIDSVQAGPNIIFCGRSSQRPRKNPFTINLK
ncbi:MAG: hypothetical protein HWN65_12720 [Candidatus Helarchaeota archaeon]|nr:hypothetical protein [Candidatus Helarchaeota archaeon]